MGIQFETDYNMETLTAMAKSLQLWQESSGY